MKSPVQLACQTEIMEIALDHLLPLRLVDASVRSSAKYKCIDASIRELGLIEPLVVYPQPETVGQYLILDGHLRLMVLKAMNATRAKCLVALDDEGFTYNHKVSRLTAIQEHFMILRAIKNGVPEARIARSLNIEVSQIRQKRDLLNGLCPEAIELLREKRITGDALKELRRVVPMRQIEIAELLCAAGTFTVGYVKCLVTATSEDRVLESERGRELKGLSPEDLHRLERETEYLAREFKLIEESYGNNVLELVIVIAYIRKLLANARIARYLAQNHPEIHLEFKKLCELRNLEEGIAASSISE